MDKVSGKEEKSVEKDTIQIQKCDKVSDPGAYTALITGKIPLKNMSPADGFWRFILRRAEREPLQHILGKAYFMGLELVVTPDVLIPRPETEVLCETVLEFEKERDIKLLDLGTGSGCISIALKKIGGYEKIIGSDISEAALGIARKNASRNGAEVDFILSDLFDHIKESYDIIVSNPPYIAGKQIDTLAPEVRLHDPIKALDGGPDGLRFYRLIAALTGQKVLKPGGRLYLEIGCDQGPAVCKLLREAGFEDICLRQDLARKDRVISARKASATRERTELKSTGKPNST